MRAERLIAGAALLAGVLWSARAAAFCRTTTCLDCPIPNVGCVELRPQDHYLAWASSCVSYDVQGDGSKWATYDTVVAIADNTFLRWTGVTCPDTGGQPAIRLMNMGAVTCDKQEYNDQSKSFGGNANVIMFHDDAWDMGTSADPASTLALTTVTFAVDTGEIYDADIEVNGTKMISTDTVVPTDAYDLQSILAHEMGHFLGLAHSTKTCTAALGDCPTMNAYYTPGFDSNRTLEADDAAGICTIYPPDRTAATDSCTPRHGFSRACGTATAPSSGCSIAPAGGGAATAAAALLALAFVSAARRRRASR